MLSEIQNAIEALMGLKGLRNILWTLLLVGLALLIFESVTQYFSVSSLQEKAELLTTLNQMESTPENKKDVEELHTALINEIKSVFFLVRNPSAYIVDVLIRFFKGFYLSLPLFYFFFRGVTHISRRTSQDIKENPQIQRMALFFGSLLFSAALWLATVLGAVSVFWNKSESLFISWLVFPLSSVAFLLITMVWLTSLSIMISGGKKNEEAEG
jgi:hypothetical protein